MEEFVEVEVQEFDGKEYMLIDTLNYNNGVYDLFACIDKPDDIKAFRHNVVNNEIYYIPASHEDILNLVVLFKENNE